jgi:hypothetical protein
MTANGEAQEVADSKATIPVKQQIIWRNVVLLTVIHLLALYAVAVILPRLELITLTWRKCQLPVTYLHKYLNVRLLTLSTGLEGGSKPATLFSCQLFTILGGSLVMERDRR